MVWHAVDGTKIVSPASEQRAWRKATGSRFVDDATKDQWIGPVGPGRRIYRCSNYESGPVRWQWSSSETGRTVPIHPQHDVVLRQREKPRDDQMRALFKPRGGIVEPGVGMGESGNGFQPLDLSWNRERAVVGAVHRDESVPTVHPLDRRQTVL
jgi:hypothetical protein